MQTYKVLGSDGKEYGPITADVLRQWIAQRRAVSTTLIQTEGCPDWKALSAFPELADALAASQPPPGSAGPIPANASPAGPVKSSGLAVASLVCGALGFLCLPALASLVLGIIALIKIRRSEGRLGGQPFAIIGMCLSGFMLITAVPIGAGLMLPALARAKSKAQSIHCINNLKQIGLAARIYSNDNKEMFPPDFLSMSNELVSPKILVCPADTRHTPAASWADFDPRKNLSYDFVQPGIAESNAMNEVIFRCPFHNNVGLGDGSAQMGRRR